MDNKFRFWNGERMVFHNLFTIPINISYIGKPMQCIGSPDKNNIDIYDGDIIHRSKGFGIWTVEYCVESCAFQAYNQLNSLRYINNDTCCDINNFIEKGLSSYVRITPNETFLCKVLGNKYKNPELLEEIR